MRHTPFDQRPRLDRWAYLAALEGHAVTLEFVAGLRVAEHLLDHPDAAVEGPYRADTIEARVFQRGLCFGLKASRSAAGAADVNVH